MEESRRPQDQLGITGTEALAKTGPIQDTLEDMGKFSSHEQVQEQITCPKEAKGNSQDSGYITALEVMVKSGQMSPPSQALAISLFTQDARTQDAPEAIVKLSSHEQMQEQMTFPKEVKGNSSKFRLQYCAGGYGQIWADELSFPIPTHHPILSRCQDSGCAGGYGQTFFS
jgi:hypothetical protein